MPPLRRRLVRRAIARRAIGRAVARRAIVRRAVARRALTGGAYRRRAGSAGRAGRRCVGRRCRRSAGFTDFLKKAWGGIRKVVGVGKRAYDTYKAHEGQIKQLASDAKNLYGAVKGAFSPATASAGFYRRRRKGGRRKSRRGKRAAAGFWDRISNHTK